MRFVDESGDEAWSEGPPVLNDESVRLIGAAMVARFRPLHPTLAERAARAERRARIDLPNPPRSPGTAGKIGWSGAATTDSTQSNLATSEHRRKSGRKKRSSGEFGIKPTMSLHSYQ
jgi:hypothetical protein